MIKGNDHKDPPTFPRLIPHFFRCDNGVIRSPVKGDQAIFSQLVQPAGKLLVHINPHIGMINNQRRGHPTEKREEEKAQA